jgi:hypothetical protein
MNANPSSIQYVLFNPENRKDFDIEISYPVGSYD